MSAGAATREMIEVTGLTRYYGDTAAVSDVSFQVAEGEIIGLLGLNGAGKSTTLKILAGLIVPSSGSVRIAGVDALQDPDALRARIGYLPEEPPLYRDMTVTGFLRHIGRLKGMTSAAVERRLPEVIELADLQGREDQVIATLSHGYRKRVGIAQAVIHDPKLVILDEPISGLDPAQIVEMRKVVRALGKGRAVLISSHILGEISQTCDRILVLNQGRLVAQGTEAELTARGGATKLLVTVRADGERFVGWLNDNGRVATASLVVPPAGSLAARESRPDVCTARVELHADEREALLSELVRAGFGLRLVEGPDDDLEEVFLGLIHQETAA